MGSRKEYHPDPGMLTVPLVLHRVTDSPVAFEDISTATFRFILHHVADCWTTFEPPGKASEGCQKRWLLTFDDGYSSDFETVFPLLQNAGAQAVFFPIVQAMGTPGHLTWEQAREMCHHGMMFGSHGLSHARMTRLGHEEAFRELRASRLELEDRLGVAIRAFSFPYGDYSRVLATLAMEAGYETCCTSEHGTVRLPAPLVPRNSVNSTMKAVAVRRTLDIPPMTRLGWCVEDALKGAAKKLLGEKGYYSLRGIVCR